MYNLYFIIDGETNMRHMGHIAHLINHKTCDQIHIDVFFLSFHSKLNELHVNHMTFKPHIMHFIQQIQHYM